MPISLNHKYILLLHFNSLLIEPLCKRQFHTKFDPIFSFETSLFIIFYLPKIIEAMVFGYMLQ